jgi:hypothetical protein
MWAEERDLVRARERGSPAGRPGWGWYGSAAMKLLRRIMSALAIAGLVAGVLRVRGSGGTPPQHGGWRPLELPDR